MTQDAHQAVDHWTTQSRLGTALRPQDRASLRRASHRIAFRRGDVLWRTGSAPKGLLVVLEGRVRVLRSRNGRQHLVHVSGPGDTMGEVAVLDGAPYPATAIAASAGHGVRIPAEAIHAVASQNGAVGLELARRLGARVRVLIDRLQDRTVSDVRSRVAAALLGAASGSADSLARISGTQAEWAEDLGTVREVLARELARFRNAGWIEAVAPGTWRLVDDVSLEAAALE